MGCGMIPVSGLLYLITIALAMLAGWWVMDGLEAQ